MFLLETSSADPCRARLEHRIMQVASRHSWEAACCVCLQDDLEEPKPLASLSYLRTFLCSPKAHLLPCFSTPYPASPPHQPQPPRFVHLPGAILPHPTTFKAFSPAEIPAGGAGTTSCCCNKLGGTGCHRVIASPVVPLCSLCLCVQLPGQSILVCPPSSLSPALAICGCLATSGAPLL